MSRLALLGGEQAAADLNPAVWPAVNEADTRAVPAVPFIASASASTRIGAIPVFVDSDPERVSISPQAMEKAITPRTSAVVAVHYGGYPVDLDAVLAVTRTHN